MYHENMMVELHCVNLRIWQLFWNYDNKGFLVVWKHALFLTKLWRLEFYAQINSWHSQTCPNCVFQPPLASFFIYIFLSWREMQTPTISWRTLCCLTFSSPIKILKTLFFLWSLLNLNQSHFLQQVQVAVRLNLILFLIIIILLCSLFVLVDCPLSLSLW